MTMTEPHRTGLFDRYRYADLRELMTRMTGNEKHASSATSTLDVLWVLDNRVLRVTPSTMDDSGRNRFLLSKGHDPMAYYAVLAAHLHPHRRSKRQHASGTHLVTAH